MRISEAALALIRRAAPDGQPRFLARWNDRWQRFALVGGHREPGESFRQCCEREVSEELGLAPGSGFRVVDEPLGPVSEYRALSGSTGVETLYRVALYAVELLTPEGLAAADTDPALRWLAESEIHARRCADGRPVADQIATVFTLFGVHHAGDEPDPQPTHEAQPMTPEATGTGPPLVIWTHRAEQRLQAQLRCAEGADDRLDPIRSDLDARLRCAFPTARTVVVLEVYLGFRPRIGEYILFADARGGDCGTAIVKMADDTTRLARELAAWRGCSPVCFAGNAVFMGLSPRPAGDGPPVALVYQDAQPHIGADEVVWLETAALGAVRFGSPDLHTVVDTVRELFGHLGRVLYAAARVAPFEADGHIELNPRDGGPRRRLRDFFEPWDGLPSPAHLGALRVRQQVGSAFPHDCTRYLDPVDYARFLEGELAAGARPDEVLPRRLRGPAHGDLHARNVLVGVDGERVGTPALFDYENMSGDNLVGLDLAKLETELKIRALDALGPTGRLSGFAARCEQFETRLAARTTECRESGNWPDEEPKGADPFARLEVLILSVREQAEAHLGTRRKRFRDWLHEYYFLLACYGLSTVRFENQNDRERAAALVSAGVACAQYESGRPGAAPIGGAL